MIELQDILAEHGETYCRNYKLPLNIIKAINNIILCRTAELDGHVGKFFHTC